MGLVPDSARWDPIARCYGRFLAASRSSMEDGFATHLSTIEAKNGIDADFYVPDGGLAVQVAYSIEGQARAREVESLVRLAAVQPDMRRFVIVTKQEQQTIEAGGVTIEVVPAWRFLLSDPALRGA